MAPVYDESPEVAHSNQLPEVYHPQGQGHDAWSPQQSTVGSGYGGNTTPKPETSQYYVDNPNAAGGAGAFTLGSQNQIAPQSIAPDGTERTGKRVVFGCSLLVLVLSMIIALLSVAVIGLAAGTGVAASNYNEANTKLNALSASYSSLQATATIGSTVTTTVSAASSQETTGGSDATLSERTNGCSDKNEDTTGETYDANFFDKSTFTMYCNRNAPGDPIYSLFTDSFNGCMEACNAWNAYNSTDDSCSGLSFIPPWSEVDEGVTANSPGSCYLKSGSLSSSRLDDATDCHAAIIKD